MRIIEETFPIKEVSNEAVKEKSIRHGHPSTLHIWWARRPLASSRATNYAALAQSIINKNQFIVNLCKWENSLNKDLLFQARKDIKNSHNGNNPKILDPFAGGGSIPLEASRLGCETYAIDYNPVAVLIEKCTIEFPMKYGPKLVDDIQLWGNRVLEIAEKELKNYYPYVEVLKDGKKYSWQPIGYIWARTVICPQCLVEIPLMKQYWLSRKKNRTITLAPYIGRKKNKIKISFKILGENYGVIPTNFNPRKGTVHGSVIVCPVCNEKTSTRDIKKIFSKGSIKQRPVAIVYRDNTRGKKYVLSTENDNQILINAHNTLQQKRKRLSDEWEIDPLPVESIVDINHKKSKVFSIQGYGIKKWSDLFNSRQQLVFVVFCETIKIIYEELLKNNKEYSEEYRKAVISYLALILDRVMSYNSMFGRWHVTGEKATDLFAIQNISWVWDYCETNPLSNNFSWKTNQKWVIRYLQHATSYSAIPTVVKCASATQLPFSDEFFDAVFTDPPYYDNISYSNLSDFFYVLLKRSVAFLYPMLFNTELVPKSEEIIAKSSRHSSKHCTKIFFEKRLTESLHEIYRVLKNEGIAVIVYTHRSMDGWESLINAIMDSKLKVTATLPISTEMRGRLKVTVLRKSEILSSTIYIILRKSDRESKIDIIRLSAILKAHFDKKIKFLSSEGIISENLKIAMIGSSLEIISRYKKITEGNNVIKADQLLLEINKLIDMYPEVN